MVRYHNIYQTVLNIIVNFSSCFIAFISMVHICKTLVCVSNYCLIYLQTEFKQSRAHQPRADVQLSYKPSWELKTKQAQKSWDNDSMHVHSTPRLRPHGATKHPHPIPPPTHSAPPMYDIPLCVCYKGEEKESRPLYILPLQEWSNESELSNKRGTYIQEPHMVLRQKRREACNDSSLREQS